MSVRPSLAAVGSLPALPAMDEEPEQPNNSAATVAALSKAIEAVSIATRISGVTGTIPATVALFFIGLVLTKIRDSVADDEEYIELGAFCKEICGMLEQGTNVMNLVELGQFARNATTHLKGIVAEIQKQQAQLNLFPQLFRARDDKKIKSKL